MKRTGPAIAIVFAVCAMAPTSFAGAQEAKSSTALQSNVVQPGNVRSDSFVQALDVFAKQVDTVHKDLLDAIEAMKQAQTATPDSKRIDVTSIRNKIQGLDRILGPEAPFPKEVESFDNWLTANVQRLSKPNSLMPQGRVEEFLAEYRGLQARVTGAREIIVASRKDMVSMQQDLAASEMIFAEWLVLGQAKKAVDAMSGSLDGLKVMIEAMKEHILEFGRTAVRS